MNNLQLMIYNVQVITNGSQQIFHEPIKHHILRIFIDDLMLNLAPE